MCTCLRFFVMSRPISLNTWYRTASDAGQGEILFYDPPHDIDGIVELDHSYGVRFYSPEFGYGGEAIYVTADQRAPELNWSIDVEIEDGHHTLRRLVAFS